MLSPRLQFTSDKAEEAARCEWWNNRGVKMQSHHDGSWYSYLPMKNISVSSSDAAERIPLLVLFGDTDDPLDTEALGAVQAACARGCAAVIVRLVNDDKLLDCLLSEVSEILPIDPGKIYFAGFGYGATCGARHAVRHCSEVAALCLMSEQYYGYDSTHEEVAKVKETGLPMVAVHGLCERRGILPYTQDSPLPLPKKRAPNVTVSTLSCISSYSEIRFWRELNGCKEISLSAMQDIPLTGDAVERAIGLPFDRTEIISLCGKRRFVGDVLDPEGVCRIRYIAVEDQPHFPAPGNFDLALDFLLNFSR